MAQNLSGCLLKPTKNLRKKSLKVIYGQNFDFLGSIKFMKLNLDV